jgi:hypothetical protein
MDENKNFEFPFYGENCNNFAISLAKAIIGNLLVFILHQKNNIYVF